MRFVNLIKLIFVVTTMMVVSACVPKAVDKKATCSENQAFDSVTRSCYSIAEIRFKPVATLASETFTQETAKTITLPYTDKNNDLAVSCSITGSYSKFEIMSPAILNGNLLNAAFEVQDSAEDLANSINASLTASVAIKNAATNAKNAGQLALTTSKTTFTHSKVISEIGKLKTEATTITALAVNFPTDNSIQYFYNLAQTKITNLNSIISSLDNKCECNGGVCSALVIPKINQSGTERFNYSITDADGTSAAKTVTTTITALAPTTSHLKPVAVSSYEIFAESPTSTASDYTFDLPSGADFIGTSNFTYKITANGVTTKGRVYGCAGLINLDGLSYSTSSDSSCSYKPSSGDDYDSNTVVSAANTIDDLTYEALNPGVYGSNITIQYFNLQSFLTSVDPYLTKAQIYGMISSYNESFVRVVGNAIKVFINPGFTSSKDIENLINTHVQASKMVTVVGGDPSNKPTTALTPSPMRLSSVSGGVDGVDAFDKISFTVSNAGATSVNTANVMIKIVSTDDAPAMNFVAATASTALEDTNPVIINLTSTFTDVDTDDVVYYNGCQVNPADVTFLANFTVNSCTCVLSTCSLNITPGANVSHTSPYTFSYRIGSSVGVGAFNPAAAQWTAYRNYNLTMTPVNDAPILPAIANQSIAESTSTVPNSGTVTVTPGPGGGTFESTQTFTLTATSSNTTLLPNANIQITGPVAGVYSIKYTPVVNKSGSATINLTLKDSGGTTNGGVDTAFGSFVLTVTPVDDPPYFISMFTTVDTNEGGAVQTAGVQVDEDMGSSSDEDTQGVRISAVTSDNLTVLPISAISFFYDLNDNGVLDSGEARLVGQVLENAPVDDVKLHKIYFKLSPVNGEDGNSNIGITLSDGSPTTTTKMFSLVVHPISSQHGGWENIAAVGIKTDKKGLPISIGDQQCNYNIAATDTYKCSGSDCTGSASPHGVIVPDAANVIFYDSANKKCYRSTSASEFSWVDLKTSCPITRAAGVCSNNNCMSSTVPTPSFVGQFHYDVDDGICKVSKNVTPATWETYIPSKVTLAWKPFTISGTGADSGVQIAGWNVYRREAGTDFNLRGGHLKVSSSTTTMTITDPSVRTFTDTTAIAGKVYYYLVRPVDNRRNLPTFTDAIYSEVRVTAPTENYSFVHRWMINQEICNSMNMTTATTNNVDQTNNFRCPYYGPGGTGSGFYDYGSDLLVDVQEMGCAYAAAPKCSADGCVGISAPTSTTGVTTNDLYYDRSSGSCFAYNGGWVNINSLVPADVAKIVTASIANADKLKTALNAPLVNLPQANAVAVCSNRPNQISLYGGLTAGALTPKLPSKKDYTAYSSHSSTMNDADISDLEQGFSLNIQSRCNGSAASGLETTFSDSPIPSTSNMYTLPGTAASGIRSLVTGSIPLGSSKSTESCVSRFGVQDIYGNVAEWTTDKMNCATKVCTPTIASSTSFDFYTPTPGTHMYAFDLETGPYSDTNNSGHTQAWDTLNGVVLLDDYISSWTLADEFHEAGKFALPTGMPISNNITTTSLVQDSEAVPFMLDIGPSSGITSSKLHDDGFILNGVDGQGSLVVGGSFASGARSGRWTTELVPDAGYADDIGFRCVVPILKTSYPADTAHVYPY
jgi:hypothetical protein